MKVIAIDLGATSGRVMTITHKNHHFSYQENSRFLNRTYTDENGYLHWDFPYLFENIKKGILTALSENPDAESISIDTWGVDYGIVRDGKLLHDPYCYRDSHSFESQKKTLAKIPFSKIYSLTGIQNIHFNTIYQLAGDPTEFLEGDTFLMMPDLIAYFLSGAKRLEETNASTTSLYLRKEGKISRELLHVIGVDESLFPPIIKPGETYGLLKKEFLPKGLNKDIKVIACGSHDTASAVLGANGEGDFAYISSGTWSLIGTELQDPLMSEQCRLYNFTNEIGYNQTIRFLKNTMGMFIINEIRNDFKNKGIEISNKDIVPLVNMAKDVNATIDVNDPVFEKPGNMIAKMDKYLADTKQEKPTTLGEYMKLIYHSMAKNYKETISQLEELTNRKIHSILIVGGGNQAAILNQYLANACQIKVVTGASEATILGNAMAQFIALGEIPNAIEGRKDIAASISSKTYYPNC